MSARIVSMSFAKNNPRLSACRDKGPCRAPAHPGQGRTRPGARRPRTELIDLRFVPVHHLVPAVFNPVPDFPVRFLTRGIVTPPMEDFLQRLLLTDVGLLPRMAETKNVDDVKDFGNVQDRLQGLLGLLLADGRDPPRNTPGPRRPGACS